MDVGIALGAVALIVPAYQLYRDCSALFMRTRHYLRDLKRCGENLLIQQRLFANEFELILSLLVEKEDAVSMLADCDHFRWKNSEFNVQWEQNMGKDFDIAIEKVSETLKEIEAKLSKLQSQICDNATPTQQNVTLSRTQRLKAFGWKADWKLTGKAELEKLIETLRLQNIDLGHLRKQRQSSQMNLNPRPQFRKLDSKPGPGTILAPTVNPDAILKKLLAIREVSKTLYDGLSTAAKCRCHRVHLQLQGCLKETDFQPGTSTTISSARSNVIRFRVIVSHDAEAEDVDSKSITNCDCNSIIINSEFESVITDNTIATVPKRRERVNSVYAPAPSRKRVRFASPDNDDNDNNEDDNEDEKHYVETTSSKAILTVSDNTKTNGKRTMSFDLGPGPKRVCFRVTECGDVSISAKIGDTSTSLSVAEVDDLCTLMKNLQPSKKPDECLGRIPNKGHSLVYRHLIYRGVPSAPFQTSRTSLERILGRDQPRIYRIERLNIALTLSVSMLNIGSYSWFQECWRSKDIFFFLGSGPQERFLQNALQLYVVPAFPRSLDHRPPHRRSRARNELLFSLALVLIEIAFGERLFKIYEPKQIYEEEGDQVHLAEYDKAKAILDSGMLQMEMGVSYAEVVTRCFYCDFGILNKDLNEEDLQKLFYEMVVKKLEECLEGFGTI